MIAIKQSQQKDGVVGLIQFLSVHKRIKIEESVSGTKRLMAKISELYVLGVLYFSPINLDTNES